MSEYIFSGNGQAERYLNASVRHRDMPDWSWTWLFSEEGADETNVLLKIRKTFDPQTGKLWHVYPVPEEHVPMMKSWAREESPHLNLAWYIEERWPECPLEFYQIVRDLAGSPVTKEVV